MALERCKLKVIKYMTETSSTTTPQCRKRYKVKQIFEIPKQKEPNEISRDGPLFTDGFGTFHNTEGIVSGGFFAQAKSVRALVPTKKFLLNSKVMLLLLFKRF